MITLPAILRINVLVVV